MAKAEKLFSGRWRCKAYLLMKQESIRVSSLWKIQKKEAEGLAAIFLLDRKHDSKIENTTFAKVADKFIENRSNLLSPATIATYSGVLVKSLSINAARVRDYLHIDLDSLAAFVRIDRTLAAYVALSANADVSNG